MNEYELQRVIRFVKLTRDAYVDMVPSAEPDATWNIITHLIESEVAGQMVTVSTLVDVAGLPYATGLRRVHRMIDEGVILRRARTGTGKSFTLHPSAMMIQGFETYARKMKCLLAETFGRPISSENEEEFYFGGATVRSPGSSYRKEGGLRFLLHDDNYFTSMRNMWVDFRSNLASRRDFEMCVLPDLYGRLIDNARAEISAFDVVTVNLPWLAEFASKGLLRSLDGLIRPEAINAENFQPIVWESGAWEDRQYAVPIYVTVEILAARSDLFAEADLAFPRTFDDVIAAGRTLHAPDRGRYGIVWNAARGMPLAHSFMFLLACCGGAVVDWSRRHGLAGKDPLVRIDSDAGRQVLDYMHRLEEISPPDILTMEWKRGLELFLHGHSAMSYVWTMRAARFEYDIHSAVKRKVKYLPQPAGQGGSNLSPIGGFHLAIPANLPEHRVKMAFDAISSMASPEAMRVHVKNGFPVFPRFSVAADPEVSAGSPIIGVVDDMAKRHLLGINQRPRVRQYTVIERILGTVLHRALTRECSDAAALKTAQAEVEAVMARTEPAYA
jgi:multiple sugar transport system substrate-binding protein